MISAMKFIYVMIDIGSFTYVELQLPLWKEASWMLVNITFDCCFFIISSLCSDLI